MCVFIYLHSYVYLYVHLIDCLCVWNYIIHIYTYIKNIYMHKVYIKFYMRVYLCTYICSYTYKHTYNKQYIRIPCSLAGLVQKYVCFIYTCIYLNIHKYICIHIFLSIYSYISSLHANAYVLCCYTSLFQLLHLPHIIYVHIYR